MTRRGQVEWTCLASQHCGSSCSGGERSFSTMTETAQAVSAAQSYSKVSPFVCVLKMLHFNWAMGSFCKHKWSDRETKINSHLVFFLFPYPSPPISPCSDGLQPQSPVFRDVGATLLCAGQPTRHSAGPLHPSVHPAPDHDTGVQGERHGHDGQHPHQL